MLVKMRQLQLRVKKSCPPLLEILPQKSSSFSVGKSGRGLHKRVGFLQGAVR